MRSFAFKVNRKEKRAALRAALSAHASEGTLALFDAGAFDAPSTRVAADLVGTWAKELPLVVVVTEEEEVAQKSFRNLAHVVVTTPAELEVAAIVWARATPTSGSYHGPLRITAADCINSPGWSARVGLALA